jgi:hypothetical protein
MLSLGQPPALAAAPMRSPALPTVAPYDDSRADADSPAVRSLPTRGPHLASRTAHADVARSKALLPQCAYTHSRKPSRYTHSLAHRLCGFDCMRRHGICDGRCVARRLGPVGMIRLCACGVPASAHLLHRLEHCHTGDAAPKAEADDREGAQARADPPAGRYLQSTGVLQYAEIREYPKSTSASQCPAVGQPTPSHLLVPPRVLVPRGRLHARTVPSAAPRHGRVHCAFSAGEHSEVFP